MFKKPLITKIFTGFLKKDTFHTSNLLKKNTL